MYEFVGGCDGGWVGCVNGVRYWWREDGWDSAAEYCLCLFQVAWGFWVLVTGWRVLIFHSMRTYLLPMALMIWTFWLALTPFLIMLSAFQAYFIFGFHSVQQAIQLRLIKGQKMW